ncbi:MAG: hypothetical protein IPL18_16480 [Sphingomonadales bacterium]|nr:hypothetical protein [Sphingomonadales bacterium]
MPIKVLRFTGQTDRVAVCEAVCEEQQEATPRDAEAIRGDGSAQLRSVPVKTIEQQDIQATHRIPVLG